MKEELVIKVELTATDEVKGESGTGRMIHFGGTADCPNFKGEVLPGGVDTQKECAGKPPMLSARYILEGVDKDGQECRIFIENNGCFREGKKNETVPLIFTDSKALSYLEHAILRGTIEPWEKGVIIRIFSWSAPKLPADMPHGDMPGDKVEIGEEHIRKAELIFRELLPKLEEARGRSKSGRAVIAVCGGSGVGKSETASLLAYYLNELGIGAYTMSGDNYPRRIPVQNDAERLRVFRTGGIRALTAAGEMTAEHFDLLQQWQQEETDASPEHAAEAPWFGHYLDGGCEALKGYLGTKQEIDFDEVSGIVDSFRAGADEIYLKRMGRSDSELWYEKVDFSDTDVLVIEWTHGNSDYYEGVDIPILLNSTPEETLAHRRARNRDGKTDSAFTTLVLKLEQELLKRQAHKAGIIVTKAGALISYEEYLRQMGEM